MKKRAEDLHHRSIVALCHEDVPVDIADRRMNGEKAVLSRVHLPRYRQGGVNLVVMTVGGDQVNPFCRPSCGFPTYTFGALYSIAAMYDEVGESEGSYRLLEKARDLDEIGPSGPIGLILHLEGAQPLAGQIHMVKVFHRLGVRSMQFVWYGRNELADSTWEDRPGGLSRFGIDVVKAMNDVGMLIDVSHIAEPCFYDIIEISKRPVIASHSNAKALADHPRNLTDDQIKALAQTGGLVGVVFYPKFVSEKHPDIEDVLNHVDYIRDLVGVDHIGVGPDFLDYIPEHILGQATFSAVTRYPKGLENVTRMSNFTEGLVRRGYDDESIMKILGGNLVRVLKRAWE